VPCIKDIIMMMKMMMMIIIIIIVIIIIKATKSENCRKQSYWALHTYFGKCQRKSTVEPTRELEIWAPQTVTRE
jgi:regulator of protease activity HflC (stomatin/prohibitin superfamily)